MVRVAPMVTLSLTKLMQNLKIKAPLFRTASECSSTTQNSSVLLTDYSKRIILPPQCWFVYLFKTSHVLVFLRIQSEVFEH